MTTDRNETLVVLKPPRATISVVRTARAHKWRHVQRIDPGERRLYEEIFEVSDTGTVVRVIDDHFVQIVFVALTGDGREQAESILRAEIETLDDAAIDGLLTSDQAEQRATGVRILGAIAPDTADRRTLDAFTRAAADRSAEVLDALIAAVGRAAWPELWPVVDEIATRNAEAEELAKAYGTTVPRSG